MIGTTAILLGVVAGLFGPGKTGSIELNGVVVQCRWSDGDSCKIKTGSQAGHGVRLMGYNSLESYGPVHSWGDWTPHELSVQAKSLAAIAAKTTWKCEWKDNKTDHYNRLLVRCPDLIEFMVGEGHAHLFEIDSKPTAKALAAQQAAIKAKKGIWAKGAPAAIITSLHSVTEKHEGESYNRVADTKTGIARQVKHTAEYSTCQKVCMEGSCMVYVPYKNRYKNRPKCLWKKR